MCVCTRSLRRYISTDIKKLHRLKVKRKETNEEEEKSTRHSWKWSICIHVYIPTHRNILLLSHMITEYILIYIQKYFRNYSFIYIYIYMCVCVCICVCVCVCETVV